MKISTRNAFRCVITNIIEGPVVSEVVLHTEGGEKVVSIITTRSIDNLQMAVGEFANVYIKASWVVLMTGAKDVRFTARNQWDGRVSAMNVGAVNTEVTVTLPSGATVYAMVTNHSVEELGLTVGAAVTVLIKSSHVLVGMPNQP